ncbi:hypothetical protein H0H92_002420 [Tricholoma furcatifolium]|nr:hypothetical protein H0H92_002420 [Tricholoma furcatifolium]
MSRQSVPPSPNRAVVPISEWQPVLHVSNQVVLYNPRSHALSIRKSNNFPERLRGPCPYCKQTLPADFEPDRHNDDDIDSDPAYHSRASDYFQLLANSNEASSRPSTPPPAQQGSSSTFPAEKMAEGYFKAFFQEEMKLGMGANGLDDFIDVRLGRAPQHIHIDPLAQFIFPESNPSSRVGTRTAGPSASLNAPVMSPSVSVDSHSRSARIRAFRQFQHASPAERERIKREMAGVRAGRNQASWKAVHLLSAEEVKSLFQDVATGLDFLHNKSILHLDLKPGNVLLTWDEGKLIPRAMLSDFGTSRDMLHNSRHRSGNTGTLEYTSPESLPSPLTGLLQQVDSKSDMWSLGMILHKLLFFRLPYRYAAEGDANGEPVSVDRESDKMDRLEKEVLSYPGFKSTNGLVTAFEARRLPRSFLVLLESLLHVTPASRPSCDRVTSAIKDGKLDPLKGDILRADETSSVALRRPDSFGNVSVPPPIFTSMASSPSDSNGGSLEDVDGMLEPEDGETTPTRASLTEVMSPVTAEEKLLLLGPPSPTPHTASQPMSRRTVQHVFKISLPDMIRPAMQVHMWKVLKSCVLVAKVSCSSSIQVAYRRSER